MKVEIKVKVKIDDFEKDMTIAEAQLLRDALNTALGQQPTPTFVPNPIFNPDPPTFVPPTWYTIGAELIDNSQKI